MQYSLLSRFQGTLLGVAVGEALGYPSGQSTLGWQDLGQGHHLGLSQNQSAPLGQLVRLQVKTLVDGDLGLGYWVTHFDAASPGLLPAQVIAGTLPVILFFHEDEAKLGQKVAQTTRLWQAPTGLRYGALALAYAIAQALRERLDPATLIAQTAAYLRQSFQQDKDHPELLTLLVLLEQVQLHLVQGSGLETTLIQLFKLAAPAESSSVAIALAFYCFLCTPEDYRLTVMRAVRTAHQPQLTALGAAVLSGTYNSSAGMPPGWRVALSESVTPGAWQQSTLEAVVPLADQLLAAWSGVYKPTSRRVDPGQGATVAAPGVLRPR